VLNLSALVVVMSGFTKAGKLTRIKSNAMNVGSIFSFLNMQLTKRGG